MRHFRARLARTVRSDRGAVLPILALFITVLVLATSLAVDIGRLSDRNRDLQKIADLVSLDAVREIHTTTSAALVSPGSDFLNTVESSAANNGFPITCATSLAQPNYEATCTSTQASSQDTLTVDVGFWCTATDVIKATSPCLGQPIPQGSTGMFLPDSSGSNVPTAVRIHAGDFVKYYFGLGLVHGQTATRGGTSAVLGTADFGLGTSLASLNSQQSTLLGQLLNALFGFNLTTQVVGWNGLASDTITLSDLATQLGLSVGSPTSLLTSNVTFAQFVAAAAQVLNNQGDAASASALSSIATSIPNPLSKASFNLGDLFSIDASDINAALTSSVNVLQLMSTAAQVANGSNSLTVNTGGFNLPGNIAQVGSVGLQITQPVQFRYGAHVGDSLQAGQVSLSVNLVNISTASLTNLINLLLPGLLNLKVAIGPATVSTGLANGQAKLTSVACKPTPTFTLSVSSGLASLGLNLPVTATATGVSIPLITGKLIATQSQNGDKTAVTYTFPPDSPGEAKDVGGGSLFWASPTVDSSNLKVANVLPFGTVVASLTNNLAVPLLNAVATQVIQPMQELLGLTVGDATVFAGPDNPPVHCVSPELVQ